MNKLICFHLVNEPNGYLSNWYSSPFILGGISYSSVEQYMMYQKAFTFGDTDIANAVLATAPHILAECALRDKVWGIGMTMHDEYRFEPDLWEGQNLLGFTLMMVREELKTKQ